MTRPVYRGPVPRPAPVTAASRAAQRPPRVQEQWLTVAAIADELAVSKMTVYRLIERGELASIRVGRSFRVPESEFARFLRLAAS